LPDREWARLLVRSELSLVTLRREANRTSIPSKTFSAIAAGAAVVAVAPEDSDLGTTIHRHGAGVLIEPGDVDGLVAALVRLSSDDRARASLRGAAHAAAVTHYDIPALARRWATFLDTLEAGR
jgi:colanic acid biosynthesis glycosyl transferase WcaI